MRAKQHKLYLSSLRKLYDTYRKVAKKDREYIRAYTDMRDYVFGSKLPDEIFYPAADLCLSIVRVHIKFEDKFLTVSDVTRTLNITRRQLSYWDIKGFRLTRRKSKKRVWRKFSIWDLFGFTILNQLLNIGLKLNQCEIVMDWLRKHAAHMPFFLFHFAEGDPIMLSVNIEEKKIYHSYGTEIRGSEKHINRMKEPIILISLGPILRNILKNIKRKDFGFSFVKDKHGDKNKIIFDVNGERTELPKYDDAVKVFPEEVMDIEPDANSREDN